MADREGTPSGNGAGNMLPQPAKEVRLIEPRVRVPVRRGEGPTSGEAIVAVVRDALDLVTEIARDTVALSKLEVQQAVRGFVPRIVWGTVAAVTGLVGVVLGIIALFLAAKTIIPSVPGRLAVLTAILLLVAFFSTIRFARPGGGARATAPEPVSSESPGGE